MADNPPIHTGFNLDRARTYDGRVRQHIPGYEILHALSDVLFSGELPAQASLLAVGAGTGTEILAWGLKHPQWHFLGTDTAQAMLMLAQEKLTAAALFDRVRLYAGDVGELPPDLFDAASLLLVLHFVPDAKKPEMLSAIAQRLKPGAPFLLANLFGDPDSEAFKRLNAARKAWAIGLGLDAVMAEQFCDPTRPDMHIIPEERLKTLLQAAGFTGIQRVYQALTVGLWLARKAGDAA